VFSIHRQSRLHISRFSGGILVLFSICFFLWDMVVTSPIVVHDLNLQATILVEKIPQLNELKAIKFSLIRQFVPRCTHFCSVTWSDDCIKWLQSAGSFKTFRRRCLLFFSTSHHIWLCIWVNLMFLVLINVCTV
jgi:hypothetical protein